MGEKKIIYLLFLQASDGVPIRFFALLNDLVDAYYSPNMGLITHLQYPVPREEDIEDEQGHKPLLHEFLKNTREHNVPKLILCCRVLQPSTAAPT